MSTDINVTIGTSEAVEALVHRYIIAREQEAETLRVQIRTAETTLEKVRCELSEIYTDELIDTYAGPMMDAWSSWPGITVELWAEWNEQVTAHEALKRCVLDIRYTIPGHQIRSVELPIVLDALPDRERLRAACSTFDDARRDLDALTNRLCLLRKRMDRETATYLRGEMLARLVEAQAPELALTLNAIVGGTRQITSTEGRE